MSLIDSIAPYRDPDTGMVSLHPDVKGKDSDNGFVHSARYLALLPTQDQLRERDTFQRMVKMCELEPGRYCRYPGDTGQEAWDDLIAIVNISKLLDFTFHADIYNYGEQNDWNWNNAKPGAWTGTTWLGRYPDFESFVRVANGKRLGVNHQALVSGAYIAGAFGPAGETSARGLLNDKRHMFQGASLMTDAALAFWRVGMHRKYPHGLKELNGRYYGATHPIAQYSPEDFT